MLQAVALWKALTRWILRVFHRPKINRTGNLAISLETPTMQSEELGVALDNFFQFGGPNIFTRAVAAGLWTVTFLASPDPAGLEFLFVWSLDQPWPVCKHHYHHHHYRSLPSSFGWGREQYGSWSVYWSSCKCKFNHIPTSRWILRCSCRLLRSGRSWLGVCRRHFHRRNWPWQFHGFLGNSRYAIPRNWRCLFGNPTFAFTGAIFPGALIVFGGCWCDSGSALAPAYRQNLSSPDAVGWRYYGSILRLFVEQCVWLTDLACQEG